MNVSVVIPTRAGDSPVLIAELAALARQSVAPAQVIVSIDDECAPAPRTHVLEEVGVRVDIVRGPNAGPAAARNLAMPAIDSELVLFLNDDVVPECDCIEAHINRHVALDRASLLVGSAPWSFGRTPLLVIDRLVSETSLVFFYNRMNSEEPERDWGFRHAWTLNLSLPTELMRTFDERLRYPMFDDLEWAYRVTREGAPVVYEPGARVEHRHVPVYTAGSLLRREVLIGHQARAMESINPACFSGVFGEARGFMAHAPDREPAAAFASFSSRAELPGEGVDIDSEFTMCNAWRSAARRIGWLAGADDRGFECAAAEAVEQIARSADFG